MKKSNHCSKPQIKKYWTVYYIFQQCKEMSYEQKVQWRKTARSYYRQERRSDSERPPHNCTIWNANWKHCDRKMRLFECVILFLQKSSIIDISSFFKYRDTLLYDFSLYFLLAFVFGSVLLSIIFSPPYTNISILSYILNFMSSVGNLHK